MSLVGGSWIFVGEEEGEPFLATTRAHRARTYTLCVLHFHTAVV